MTRYRVGCPGMFVLGTDQGYDDRDEALIACLAGPPGCECIDTYAATPDERYIGPYCLQDHNDIADELGRPDLRLPTPEQRELQALREQFGGAL
jgi:hypothetical protein